MIFPIIIIYVLYYSLYFSITGLTIANIIPIMMLGRKQSLKGEPVLADYGPEESLNESADIEWVNKVYLNTYIFSYITLLVYCNYTNSLTICARWYQLLNNYLAVAALGEKVDEILCSSIFSFCLLEHSQNIWESSTSSICYLYLRFGYHVSIHCWNDCQNAHKGYTEGNSHGKRKFTQQ